LKVVRLPREAAGTLIVAAALLWPVAWNKFPLVFATYYIKTTHFVGIPPFYALFVKLSSWGTTLYLTAVTQALLTATVLMLFFRGVGRASIRLAAVMSLLLCIGTQLPWLVSWIMSDFLFGIGILTLLVLICGPAANRLRDDLPKLLFLVAIVGFAAASATVSLVIYVGVVTVCGAIFLIAHTPEWNARAMALVGLALAGAFLATLAANKFLFGRAELNSGAPMHTFSRLADVGIAQSYLKRHCPNERLFLCPYLPRLEQAVRGEQTFLTAPRSLATETHAADEHRDRYATLNKRIFGEYWQRFVGEGLRDAGDLFLRPALENELRPTPSSLRSGEWYKLVEYLYPRDLEPFSFARQQRGQLLRHYPREFYALLTFAGYAAMVVLTIMAANRSTVALVIGGGTAAAIVLELLMTSMLVGPFPRYHAKAGWLAWAATLAIGSRLRSQGQGAGTMQPTEAVMRPLKTPAKRRRHATADMHCINRGPGRNLAGRDFSDRSTIPA
jgi:hypothetical protein